MKVLLTGGTGFLGAHIARELMRCGHCIRVMARPNSQFDRLQGIHCETLLGDLSNLASLRRAVAGVDAVVHAAGNVSMRLRDRHRSYADNVDGTRNLMEAAVEAAGGRRMRVVYTSSAFAIGSTPRPRILNERTPWIPDSSGSAYVEAKRRAEDVALSYVNRGLDVISLCPAFVLGPGADPHNCPGLIFDHLRGRILISIDGGQSICDVRDVATAHAAALERGAVGERYILAGQNLTYDEILCLIDQLSGQRRRYRAGTSAVLGLAFAAEVATRIGIQRYASFNRPLARYAMRYSYFNSDNAIRTLGYQTRPPIVSLSDTIADFLNRDLIPASTPELRALRQRSQAAPSKRIPTQAA